MDREQAGGVRPLDPPRGCSMGQIRNLAQLRAENNVQGVFGFRLILDGFGGWVFNNKIWVGLGLGKVPPRGH